MEKESPDLVFMNPFSDDASTATGISLMPAVHNLPSFAAVIIDGAVETIELQATQALPTEDEATDVSFFEGPNDSRDSDAQQGDPASKGDMLISFRAAFSGFVVSLVDAAPSEIAVLSFRNVNAIASWNALRTTNATVYITVSDVQIDNMVPNAPFPVALSPDERALSGESSSEHNASAADAGAPPMLVIGLSFAPRHKTGIVVSTLILAIL